MLTIDRIRDVVAELGKKYGIESAYLFGSYAKDQANSKSDVDLLIERGEVNTYKQYSHLWDDLEQELGAPVDLLAVDGVKPRFFDLIKNDRILLYGAK